MFEGLKGLKQIWMKEDPLLVKKKKKKIEKFGIIFLFKGKIVNIFLMVIFSNSREMFWKIFLIKI